MPPRFGVVEYYSTSIILVNIFILDFGRRNKHGIPLCQLLSFGRTGQSEVRGWVKEWLK
jgi:hypothetical protein